jgi:hypothetical protein
MLSCRILFASKILTAALTSDTSFGQTENTNLAEGMEEALMCCILRFLILIVIIPATNAQLYICCWNDLQS